jgi:hypothetical protein
MRLRGALPLLTLALLAAPDAARAQEACAHATRAIAEGTAEFEGRVGERHIRLYLTFDMDEDSGRAVHGAIRRIASPDAWSVEIVSGVLGRDCVVAIEAGGHPKTRETWRLRFLTPTRIRGSFEPVDGRRSAVRLAAVPPPDCQAGPWRTFRSSAWPATFEYPASWRLHPHGDGSPQPLTLDCPNLRSRLLQQDYVEIQSGLTSVTPGVDGTPGLPRRADWFYTRDGRQWEAGELGCEADLDPSSIFCSAARQSNRHGMTVLQGPMVLPTRELSRFVFLLQDRWISLETDGSGVDDQGPGEVVLGDNVPSRIVRSMRPVVPAP